MLASSFNGSSSYHIETHAVANTDCMDGGNITLLHLSDNLNDLLRVRYLTVSDQYHMSHIILHLFLNVDDINQGIEDLCPTKISLEVLDQIHCFLDGLIVVLYTLFEHSFESWPETDNVEYGIFGQWFQEENERRLCLMNSISIHRSWTIQQENILSFVMIEIWFVGFGREEC